VLLKAAGVLLVAMVAHLPAMVAVTAAILLTAAKPLVVALVDMLATVAILLEGLNKTAVLVLAAAVVLVQ
jgi:hypothetical protein